jgi:hypothetical protein
MAVTLLEFQTRLIREGKEYRVRELPQPVLDPFSVYVKGEELLRQQLRAPELDLEALGEVELVALVVTATRARAAA